MGLEIERKFLVLNDNWKSQVDSKFPQGILFKQAYIPSHGATVRVRIEGVKAFLNIKSKTKGISRLEFEYEIPMSDALQLLDQVCDQNQIHKIRYHVYLNNLKWEIDVFQGDNQGLVVAELEVPSEDYIFQKPDWIGKEVSSDSKYYNVNLASNPFKNWKS